MKQAFFQLFPEKQKAVLTAALTEFGTHDFDAASLDRVVASAGISKGGLYEYIASKEELYLYCMERTWSALYAFIRDRLARTHEPLPDDILERFMTVSRIAIDWYLQNPDLLGLLVRIARLPRAALAEKAQAVFETHFSEVFAGLDASRLGYPVEQLVDLIKWLLAKTRKDLLLAIEGGSTPEALRAAYLDEWAFFCSVLAGGIYRPPPAA